MVHFGSGETLERPQYSLVNNPRLEIENAFSLSPQLWDYLGGYFSACGFAADESRATSVYFDTNDYQLYTEAHVTLRDRLGGQGTHGEVFDDVYGLKFLAAPHYEWAKALVARHAGPGRSYITPGMRFEIEESHTEPRNPQWSEFRFGDISPIVGHKIIERLGFATAEMMVVRPQLVTVTDRDRFQLLIDPDDPRPLSLVPGANPAFAHFKPHADARPSGHDVCFEFAMDDRLRYFDPPHGMPIVDILSISADIKDDDRRLTKIDCDRRVIEVEYKQKYSGLDVTDDDLIKAHLRMQDFLASADAMVESETPLRHQFSKATNGLLLKATHGPEEVRRQVGRSLLNAVRYAA